MAAAVSIIPMTAEHCAEMAVRMRAADRREYNAMLPNEPATLGLDRIRRQSRQAYAGLIDGRLVVIYGVLGATVLSTEGHPWLLATDDVEAPAARRAIARRSKREAARLLTGFQRYSNWCDVTNASVIRWLRWLGFSFGTQTVKLNGVEFVQFWKEG